MVIWSIRALIRPARPPIVGNQFVQVAGGPLVEVSGRAKEGFDGDDDGGSAD
jgi:hypothetical protein